jgi:hypothetical protein
MSTGSKNFKERTPWPIWLWLFLLFLAASLALAFWAALGTRWGAVTGLVQLLLLLFASTRTPLEIEVSEEGLRVGPAHIEHRYLGIVEVLSEEQMRQWRGPLADPAAFVALRFWVATGVKVEVKDPKDPVPYWLISSKKAQPLMAALLKQG